MLNGQTQVRFENLTVGSVITYKNLGGQHLIVQITELENDIKNGETGFAGFVLDVEWLPMPNPTPELHSGKWHEVWGYTWQITDIIGELSPNRF